MVAIFTVSDYCIEPYGVLSVSKISSSVQVTLYDLDLSSFHFNITLWNLKMSVFHFNITLYMAFGNAMHYVI